VDGAALTGWCGLCSPYLVEWTVRSVLDSVDFAVRT